MIAIVLESAVRSLILAGIAGLALQVWRGRNPHTEMAVWQSVLGLSIAMPLMLAIAPPVSLPLAAGMITSFPSPEEATHAAGPGWGSLVLAVYAAGVGIMLVRLALGLVLLRRLIVGAQPVRNDWTRGFDVRCSAKVSVPVTVGAVVLLPADYSDWDETTRRAVMAHETAHVSRGDFYVQFVAAVHRAIFWFSPLGWWLSFRLSQLAETACDVAAVEDIRDRARYAEILVAMGRKAGRLAHGLPMARVRGLGARIDSVLADTCLHRKMTARRWAALAVLLLPLSAISACVSAKPQDHLVATAQPFDRIEIRPVVGEGEGMPMRMAGSGETFYVSRTPFLRQWDFSKIIAREEAGQASLSVTVAPQATEKLQQVSAKNVGRRIALIVGSELVMAPTLRAPLTSDSFVIDGDAGKAALHFFTNAGSAK